MNAESMPTENAGRVNAPKTSESPTVRMQKIAPRTPTTALMTALTKRVLGLTSAEKYCAFQPTSYSRWSISSNFCTEYFSSLKRMTVFCPPKSSLVCAVSSPCTATCRL